MKIAMIISQIGAIRDDGTPTEIYETGKEYKSQGEWQDEIFQGFLNSGVAYQIGGNDTPQEIKTNLAKVRE